MEHVFAELGLEEGIGRAIDNIREPKPKNDIFLSPDAQQPQPMKDGEVDMTTGWNRQSDNATKVGAMVKYSFNQGLLDYNSFAIPKRAPTKDVAMALLAEMSKAKYQDVLPANITYGCPINNADYGTCLITAEIAAGLFHSPYSPTLQLPISLKCYEKWGTISDEMY